MSPRALQAFCFQKIHTSSLSVCAHPMCFCMCLLHKLSETVAVHKGSTVIPRTHSAGGFIPVFHQLVLMANDRLKTPFLLLHQCLETTWKPIFFSFSKRPTTPSLHTCTLAKIAANTKLVNFSLSVQCYEWMGAKQTQKCVPWYSSHSFLNHEHNCKLCI